MNWFSISLGHVRNVPPLLTDNDIEGCSFIFTHYPTDLVRDSPGYRCLVNEDVLAGVLGIDETVFIIYVRPFNGPDFTMIFALVIGNVFTVALVPRFSPNSSSSCFNS